MGRLRKTTSKHLDLARSRLASLRSIDPALDFGNGKDLANYQSIIDKADLSLSEYNEQLASLDDLYNGFLVDEKAVSAMNTEMLSGVKAIYGRDSDEYEQAGGTRLSERKRPKP